MDYATIARRRGRFRRGLMAHLLAGVAVVALSLRPAEASPRFYDLNSLLFEPPATEVLRPAPPPAVWPAPVPLPPVAPRPAIVPQPMVAAQPAPAAAPTPRPPEAAPGEGLGFAEDARAWLDTARIKASVGGGGVDGDGTVLFRGSALLPVGANWGTQFDALAGATNGDATWGIAGHLFWRDPDKGLLGLMTSYGRRSDHDPASMGRSGVESEWYSGRFTGIARAGYQYGDVDDGSFWRADLRWYGTDDFMLGVGGEVETGDFVGRLGAEFQAGFTALPGLSLFADAEFGEDDWYRVFAGARYYFGETKTLIRRHRTDDPENTLDDDKFARRDH